MATPMPADRPVPTCYRHPDRRAGVTCQRCDRPICPSCMTQASVGFQCPECIGRAAQRAPVYTARTLPVEQPIATYVLIGANAAVFLLALVTGGTFSGGGGETWVHGVLYGPAVAAGEWWRLFTAGFLHYGFIHIGMNMFVLWRIGTQLEQLLGHVQYVALYFAAMAAGSLGALLLSPGAATAGASGAIFGLLGAAAAYQYANKINMWQSGLAMLIGLNLVITFTFAGTISVGGHVGGLVGGGLCGMAMFKLEHGGRSKWVGVGVAAAIIVATVLVAVALAPSLSRGIRY